MFRMGAMVITSFKSPQIIDSEEMEGFRRNLKLGGDWSVCDKEYCASLHMAQNKYKQWLL